MIFFCIIFFFLITSLRSRQRLLNYTFFYRILICWFFSNFIFNFIILLPIFISRKIFFIFKFFLLTARFWFFFNIQNFAIISTKLISFKARFCLFLNRQNLIFSFFKTLLLEFFLIFYYYLISWRRNSSINLYYWLTIWPWLINYTDCHVHHALNSFYYIFLSIYKVLVSLSNLFSELVEIWCLYHSSTSKTHY